MGWIMLYTWVVEIFTYPGWSPFQLDLVPRNYVLQAPISSLIYIVGGEGQAPGLVT